MSAKGGPVPGRRLIEMIARVVPARRREAWLEEWRNELTHAWDGRARELPVWRARVRLMSRAVGSLGDALWLRRTQGGGGRWSWNLGEAIRTLLRRPGFAAAVISTLALGMGSATAIFSALDGLMLRPVPFREPEQLVSVIGANGGSSVDLEAIAQWKRQDRIFADARVHAARSDVLTGAGEPQQLRIEMVEPGFLSMLGIRPLLGRDFAAGEAVPGRDRVVLLSHEVWRSAFLEDRDILGRSIVLDGEAHTVIGVLPPTLRLLPGGIVHLVAPLADPPPYPRLNLLARLRPELTVEAAGARLSETSALLARELPREEGWGATLRPVQRNLDPARRNALYALGGAVTFLLLNACANAAGLLFVRGVTKQPEFALRVALGASRRSVFAHVFAESLVLAVLAGILGTLLAWWGVRVLVALAPSNLLRFNYTTIGIDLRVLGFALLLTFLTPLLFGIAPALRASRVSAARAGRASTASRGQVRIRGIVQVTQLALAAMLLTGAGLTGRSFLRLTAVDPGFDPSNLLYLNLSSASPDSGEAALATFNREIDARLRALPGVSGVTWSGGTGFHFDFTLEPEGSPARPSGDAFLMFTNVDTAYFRVMRIPIIAGRAFQVEDTREGANTVVIGAHFAASLWPDQNAVGRRFRLRDDPWLTVVGVSGDVKLEGPDDRFGRDLVFYPVAIDRMRYVRIALRTAGDPTALAPAARDVVREMNPALPIRSIETAEQAMAELVSQPRFVLTIMSVFAAIALVLAAVGVYGLVSFTVAHRTREIGVRMALGAHRRDVLAGVLRSGMLLGGLGALLGLAGAAALSRFTRSLLFGISPFDPVAFALVAAALLVACAAALAGPARRAAGVQPASALRGE